MNGFRLPGVPVLGLRLPPKVYALLEKEADRRSLEQGAPVQVHHLLEGLATAYVVNLERARRHPSPKGGRLPQDESEVLHKRILKLAGKHTAIEIAEQVGCSSTTVYRHLHEAGITPLRHIKRTPGPEDVAQVLTLAKSGLTDMSIARQTDLSRETVRRLRVGAGIPANSPAGRPRKQQDTEDLRTAA